jgi:hypothetical protein
MLKEIQYAHLLLEIVRQNTISLQEYLFTFKFENQAIVGILTAPKSAKGVLTLK